MEHFFGSKWIKVESDKLPFYKDTPVYKKTSNGMVKYKAEGVKIDLERIKGKDISSLYISYQDRIKAHKELSKKYKEKINNAIGSGDFDYIKKEIVNIAYEVFENPMSGTAVPAKGMVESVTEDYLEDKLPISIFKDLVDTDYNTVTHSLHVMALTLRYYSDKNVPLEKLKDIASAAMLFDVGKAYVSEDILTKQGELTEEEFEAMKKHTTYGYNVLKDLGLKFESDVALYHHERLDGSGYPYGLDSKDKIEDIHQLIGMIDSYEAMTSDYRVYETPLEPYRALKELRAKVNEGKYSFDLYSNFVRSLSDK